MFNRRRITAALIGLIVLVLGGWLVQNVIAGSGSGDSTGGSSAPSVSSKPTTGSAAKSSADIGGKVAGVDSGLAVKPLSTLPPEATDTWLLIKAGGPYPYPGNDDVVFGNREKLLPLKGSGYYHEFTVKTAGSQDRGSRRLITGQSHEVYYTGDHYLSFFVVDTNR
jgi:guanyl-specific ribonuclease Sa